MVVNEKNVGGDGAHYDDFVIIKLRITIMMIIYGDSGHNHNNTY